MIKVLIVDDNILKAQKIAASLTKISKIESEQIDTSQDLQSAYDKLKSNVYDVLILDIQIPQRWNEKVLRDGGIKFLNRIKVDRNITLPLSIIGITAYGDIYNDLSKNFTDELWALIMYEDNSDGWEQQINNKVEYLRRYKKKQQQISRKKYDYDLGIICALQHTEFESILRLSDTWDNESHTDDGTFYYTTTFKKQEKNIRVVAAYCPHMGMPAASVLATSMIYNFRPEYLVMTGIAAGVRGRVNLGDILIPDPSWDYGAGKISNNGNEKVFLPDNQQIIIDSNLRAIFKNLINDRALLQKISDGFPGNKPDSVLNLKIGPVASGAAVVANSKIVEEILVQKRSLIGLEMETYGVYYAANNGFNPKPKVFAIKSVCDFADEGKNDSFQHYAAYTSSRFLYEIATNYLEYTDK